MRPGEAPSKRLQTWNSNRAPSNLEVQGVSLSLGGHTFSSLDGWGGGGAKIPRPVLTPGWPSPDQLSDGQHILGSSPETAEDASSASLPSCPEPHSIPAHPRREIRSAGFSENVQGERPSTETRCSQLGSTPPPPSLPCGSCRDFRPQGKRLG